MLDLFVTLQDSLKSRSLKSLAFQPQSYSQAQLIHLLFEQRQCPHCNAANTLAVIPGSEAGAFNFDLSCSICTTEYEVRPASPWSKYPQTIDVQPMCNRPYTLQLQPSVLNSGESCSSQVEPAFNG